MTKNSEIQWTDHTFNPWWGCKKVSQACKHCYAETMAKRWGHNIWGSNSPRRFFSDAHWKEPLKWNAEAADAGEQQLVFCASMADVFEGRNELNLSRERLWQLIGQTPYLSWQLLTKRPQRIKYYAPWEDHWPDNVWLGTTVENQRWVEERIPHLLYHPATVRFLSCEPLLKPIDLTPYVNELQWVIVGGESGPGARPMHPVWIRRLRDQCIEYGIPFFFKQWGAWSPNPIQRGQMQKSCHSWMKTQAKWL